MVHNYLEYNRHGMEIQCFNLTRGCMVYSQNKQPNSMLIIISSRLLMRSVLARECTGILLTYIQISPNLLFMKRGLELIKKCTEAMNFDSIPKKVSNFFLYRSVHFIIALEKHCSFPWDMNQKCHVWSIRGTDIIVPSF